MDLFAVGVLEEGGEDCVLMLANANIDKGWRPNLAICRKQLGQASLGK